MPPIFITGGTGYIGKRLIKKLVAQGYDVTALVRKGSENNLPKGVRAIIADPFDAATFQQWIPKGATYIQLLGVSHPSPRKKDQFQQIDLRSVKASADAAVKASVSHFIYLSVAMTDSTIMKDFRDARKEGEAYILSKHLLCTFIRPWYVIGPGHLWPVFLLPVYGMARFSSSKRKKAEKMSLITISQMLQTLMKAIESPPQKQRVFEVKHMKRGNLPAI
jgi:uncharacterized protein YbjT (DUF2867 family)